MEKAFPTFIDETATLYEKIYFSAGKRGQQIILDPNKLAEVTDAKYEDLISLL